MASGFPIESTLNPRRSSDAQNPDELLAVDLSGWQHRQIVLPKKMHNRWYFE
jgi:hypothetical protein